MILSLHLTVRTTRAHNVLGLRGIRPGEAWNVDQIIRWLNRNPIQGEANIDFVRRQLESANFAPVPISLPTIQAEGTGMIPT